MKQQGLWPALASLLVLLAAGAARAQEGDAPKVEVGVQFTSLGVRSPDTFGTESQPGFGARVTYNFNDYFAAEAEANYFPVDNVETLSTGGDMQQLQAGVKVGKRFNRFGVFAKARPGFVSHARAFNFVESQTVVDGVVFPFFEGRSERKTHFTMDVGGVLEFYPSRRLVVRFDAGDTVVRYGERDDLMFVFPSGAFQRFTRPSEVRHNFQFSGGVGFRFGGGAGPAEDASADDRFDGERRFEAGVQFSSLTLRVPRVISIFPALNATVETTTTEAGFGARVGYNLTDHVAFEAEGNFYPRHTFSLAGSNAVGGYPSQFQAGVKAGKRFRRFGVFAKARPGLISFSSVRSLVGTEPFNIGGFQFTIGRFEDKRRNYFSMDLGGVLEFYHSRRFFTRFDFGDTIIRYPERNQENRFGFTPPFFTAPPETQHNFQFTAGLGLRF